MIKNAYLKKMESRLEDWDREIAKLKDKADKVESDARAVYREQLEILRSRQVVARKRIQELRNSGAQNWGKFKAGVEEAADDLKKAVNDAVSRLRKIA